MGALLKILNIIFSVDEGFTVGDIQLGPSCIISGAKLQFEYTALIIADRLFSNSDSLTVCYRDYIDVGTFSLVML